MKIEKNKVVSIDYTLKDDQGEVIDSSDGRDPLAYIQGIGNIIPGLESALEGKAKGEKVQVTIAPQEGYGPRNDQLLQAVPKSEFQDSEQIQVGMQFQVDTDQGPMIVSVVEVRDAEIVLDGNHPLAGLNLHFEVEVMDVREATKEELDHGHVHGPGGHQH